MRVQGWSRGLHHFGARALRIPDALSTDAAGRGQVVGEVTRRRGTPPNSRSPGPDWLMPDQ
jgi:hypothetical protein